jgi:hypothetical protein
VGKGLVWRVVGADENSPRARGLTSGLTSRALLVWNGIPTNVVTSARGLASFALFRRARGASTSGSCPNFIRTTVPLVPLGAAVAEAGCRTEPI